MLEFLRKNRRYRIAEAKLKEAISLCAPSLEGIGFLERVQFMNECIENNESGVALETLCNNLYEVRLPVPQKAIDLIREAGKLMDMESKNWEPLEPLVIDGAEPTEPGFAEPTECHNPLDEQTARGIKNTLRDRTHSDSADLLREDRER